MTSRIRLGVLCGRYHLDSKRSDSFSSLFAIYASSRQVLISTLCRFLPADFTADNRSFHANSTYAKTPYCYCSAFSSKSQELYLISRPPKIHSPFRYRVFLAESLGRVLSSVPPKNPRTSFLTITSSGKVMLTPPQNVKISITRHQISQPTNRQYNHLLQRLLRPKNKQFSHYLRCLCPAFWSA